MTSAIDPRIGSVLRGRYRIERKLGHGGMGAVYEAMHLNLEKRVALKVMHPHIGEDVTAVERFRREAIAASRTEHPHIVHVLDMDRAEDGSAFMVMERLEGRDWANELEETGAQSLGDVLHVMLQVLDALEAAHAAGIVHRDLKPENVFLTTQGGDRRFAKVLDFGVSKVLGARGPSTETGTAVGTPYYMSMEQLRSAKDVDARTDLYAVGVMLYRALTNGYPFHADSLPALVAKILTEPAPRLASVRPDLPPALDGLVASLLEQDRERRPRSANEVAAALAPLVARETEAGLRASRRTPAASAGEGREALAFAATQPSLRAPPVHIPSSRIPWVVGGGLVAAALVGGAVWWWGGSPVVPPSTVVASPRSVEPVVVSPEPPSLATGVVPSEVGADLADRPPPNSTSATADERAERDETTRDARRATADRAAGERAGTERAGTERAAAEGTSAESAAAEPPRSPPVAEEAEDRGDGDTRPEPAGRPEPSGATDEGLARGFLGGGP